MITNWIIIILIVLLLIMLKICIGLKNRYKSYQRELESNDFFKSFDRSEIKVLKNRLKKEKEKNKDLNKIISDYTQRINKMEMRR